MHEQSPEQPLDGYCVGITADRRWDEQAELLRRRGATILHGPSIRTLPLGADDLLATATEAIINKPPDILVANTGIGIRAWFESADSRGRGRALHDALTAARIYARGPKASGAIHLVGLEVAGRGRTERLRDVIDLVLALPGGLRGVRVAVQRDGRGAPDELARLRDAGADVIEIPVYEWRLPEDTKPAVRLIDALVAGRLHAVTFTSAPAVRNLVAIADEHELGDRLISVLTSGSVVIGCVGPVSAEPVYDLGVAEVVVPGAARIGPLIRTVTDALLRRSVVVGVAGDALALQGTVVRTAFDRIQLTDTEARLFALLVSKGGAVATKADLLRAVWADSDGDTHVVEVTVSRLRRRLGRFGTVIESVPRRGYRVPSG
jgi:uroporphyrinogen-III synthase